MCYGSDLKQPTQRKPMLPFPLSRPFLSLAALGALALAAPLAAQADDAPQEGKVALSKGEKRLARMLEGRVAGEPQNCIPVRPTEGVTTIARTAYVYDRGSTIYVQRTQNPDDISRNDILVIQRFNGTQLCRQDIATTVDRFVGFMTGVVQFDDFIPYTKVDADEG
jgi:hypothetical protein